MIQCIGLIILVYVLMRSFQAPLFAQMELLTQQEYSEFTTWKMDKLIMKVRVSAYGALVLLGILGWILLSYSSELDRSQ